MASMNSVQRINIFLASSAEVREERTQFITHLNTIGKSYKHLHLNPIEWEYDLPKGSFPQFENIQAAINPYLEESEICVFLFYSKLGKYTLEEFELAKSKGKKMFVFFKEGFSPKNADEIKKYGDLLTFKEALNDTVLYESYTHLDNFELKVKDSLHLYLNQTYANISTAMEPLSENASILIKLLAEKQTELDKLKQSNAMLTKEDAHKNLQQLEQEFQDLQKQLAQSKEMVAQQAKDKTELQTALQQYKGNDLLKAKALEELELKNYELAETYLMQSAKDSITQTAETFYELGKINKLKLNYLEAHRYFDLAVKINPKRLDYLYEGADLSRILGYYDASIYYLESLLPLIDKDDKSLGLILNSLGAVNDKKGNYEIAIEYYTKAIEKAASFYGEASFEVAVCLNNLGEAYRALKKYDLAIAQYEKALKIHKSNQLESHPQISILLNNIGLVQGSLGNIDLAITYLEKALSIDKIFFGEFHPEIATRYNNLGVSYIQKSNYSLAISYFEKALQMDTTCFGNSHPNIAIDYHNIANAHSKKGDYDASILYYKKSLNMFKQFLAPNHPDVLATQERLKEASEAKNV